MSNAKLFMAVVCFLLASVFSVFAQQVDELSRQDLFILARTTDPSLVNMALPPQFKFPQDARDNSDFGIDVSHHTEDSCSCQLSWDDIIRQKVKFVYFKATQGINFKDSTAIANKGLARRLQAEGKIRIGYYHFFTAVDDPVEQAELFISQMQPIERADLPPSLDLEWNPGPYTAECRSDAVLTLPRKDGTSSKRCDLWSFVPADEIISRSNLWIDKVRSATGRDPIVYTNTAWWKARLGDVRRIDQLHTKLVWIADYSRSGLASERPRSPNDKPWHVWQFSESASLTSGSNKLRVDANITSAALADLFR